MSFKPLIFVSCAAIALVAPISEASAQYRYYDRPSYERQRQPQQRPVQSQRPKPIAASTATKPVATKPVAQGSRSAAHQAKPVPPPPLTEEQLAAKAAVDELLAREPALSAAKTIPDPALVRAAAAKHSAEETKLAALKAKQEAEAAKRREAEAKLRAREEAKAAVLKAKQEAAGKNAKPKVELAKIKAAPLATRETSSAPVQPALRMPAPEGLPMARNL